MRTLIHRALSARGYTVDVAANLAEAREKQPRGYDAVLVDAHLGAERGIDLVEALQSEDPAAARRCLVITGGAADAIPDGIARLTKPFQLEALLDAVHALSQPDASPARGPHRDITPESGMHLPESVPESAGQPAATEPRAWQLLRLVRQLRARERHELVDFLHDGPIQELAAITLGLQIIARSSLAIPPLRLAETQRRLDTAAGSLRWLVDGDWPFALPETGLADAIRQRTGWLLAAPATMHADSRSAGLAAADIPVIVDVVELMLLGVLPADTPMQAQVAVRAEQKTIQIELTLQAAGRSEQPAGDPAAARAALAKLASALGTTAQADFNNQHWRFQLTLARQQALR
jgi:CheY-like chemotaxis protein